MIADMHTHSENSHDSVCKILASTKIFAVTDHYDCHSFEKYDTLTPIKNASFHFQDTLEMLREIGFEGIYYYKERKPCQLTI